jgi:acetolactate synthase-1/2/3 large subunit
MTESVADALADELAGAGVDRAFGLPGGEVLHLIDALTRRGITFTLCHHEAAAGVAAGVYGRARGTAGVALATLGPGASNLLFPLAGALLDREPLLAVSAQIPDSWPAVHTHQRLPLLEVFGPVTKFAAKVAPGGARATVRAALAAATSAPPGPAYLTLAAEDARAEAGPGGGAAWQAPELDSGPSAGSVRERLAAASAPLVLVGLGARWEAAPRLRAWLRGWGLAYGVTPKAKGMVAEDGPGFVGVFGGMALDSLLLEALRAADLVVGVGLDPVEIDKTWHAQREILWTDDAVAGELALEAAPRGWADPFGDVRRRRREALARGGELLTPASVLRAAAAAAPPGTIVTTDVGSHKFLFGQFWPAAEPGAFWMSNGLSGMGYGLPAAIAVKLARPDRPVLAVLGDGGFAMSAAELSTARRAGAALAVLVISDASLSLIRLAQESRGLPRVGVDFDPLDCVRVAEGFGAEARRATTAPELESALRRALASGTVSVVEAPLDPELYSGLV